MSDLNKEALDVWGALKPMIDQEISSRTQGMVQRRKAKVTTAPSLATNTIGVTEAFGQEIFLPFVSNMISAKVGDFVWIEWMYGATNAFVSCFAEVDEKDRSVAGNQSVTGNQTVGGNQTVNGNETVNGNATFNGTLDVTQRRCYAELSSAGWYRVFNVTGSLGRAVSSFSITLNIGRSYYTVNNELHTVTLLANYYNQEFSSEVSKSNTLGITKVRYTADGSSNGHIDIYYNFASANTVYVDFDVHCRPELAYLIRFNAVSLTSVAASPSGETVVTEYTFAANTEGTGTFTGESGVTVSEGDIKRSGNVVYVHFYAQKSWSANTDMLARQRHSA